MDIQPPVSWFYIIIIIIIIGDYIYELYCYVACGMVCESTSLRWSLRVETCRGFNKRITKVIGYA